MRIPKEMIHDTTLCCPTRANPAFGLGRDCLLTGKLLSYTKDRRLHHGKEFSPYHLPRQRAPRPWRRGGPDRRSYGSEAHFALEVARDVRLIAIESPGLTAAPALAEHVAELVAGILP